MTEVVPNYSRSKAESCTKHMSLPWMIDVGGPCNATTDECSRSLEQHPGQLRSTKLISAKPSFEPSLSYDFSFFFLSLSYEEEKKEIGFLS